MLFVYPPLSQLELTKSICLCESAEKYSAFIRVKGHGIGQCQSAEVFPSLAFAWCAQRGGHVFTSHSPDELIYTSGGLGPWCSWPWLLNKAPFISGKREQMCKRHQPVSTAMRRLPAVWKSRKKTLIFLIKSKTRKRPPSPSAPTATTLTGAS